MVRIYSQEKNMRGLIVATKSEGGDDQREFTNSWCYFKFSHFTLQKKKTLIKSPLFIKKN